MNRRYWEWDRPFSWEPTTTALLIVDMQDGFLREDSPLHVPMARAQVPAIKRVLDAFRGHGHPVVHTRFVVREDAYIQFYRSISAQRGLDPVGATSPFGVAGTDVGIVADLSPVAEEPVVDKVAYDGFADTDLELVLRSQEVETLVIAGTVVNWCVDSTLRTAFHRRFNCIVMADGVSGYDHAGASGEEWVARELDFFAESFAVVAEGAELVDALTSNALRQAGGRSRAPERLSEGN